MEGYRQTPNLHKEHQSPAQGSRTDNGTTKSPRQLSIIRKGLVGSGNTGPRRGCHEQGWIRGSSTDHDAIPMVLFVKGLVEFPLMLVAIDVQQGQGGPFVADKIP